MPTPSAPLKEIFAEALRRTDPAERAAYLAAVCPDAGMRRRVEALLLASEDPASFLDPGAEPRLPIPVDPTATTAHSAALVGTVIAGRYKLLEAIGEGGMGTVWVAEQTEPVRRKVALKLIKAGMDSKSVLARFEAERQALAVMDHPNIAKVLDGGVVEAHGRPSVGVGRPFFVMEYVKGVPITEYCDATRLSVPERLNLFVQVCHAVQHAHQKGIIHRDLKPSNILVAPYDDRPVPKVIDFGLAKAMHQSLTELTLHTAHETVLGTPLYMSPEQAQLNNLDVDTRSDIYSLGVLLYELLTGTTPLEKKRYKEAAWDEIKRIIREEEPPRPSTRLSSSNTLASLAAGRQIEPARLTKLVRGELDWIVMKSLEKDRNRRYETANGFAMDIQCFLSGEPVLAAPPSMRYRLRKFARKHQAALTMTAAIGLLLVAGVTVSTWQALRALSAEAAAKVAEQDALQAQREEAERANGEHLAKLDAEAKRAEAVRQQARAEAGEKLASDRLVQVDAEKKKAEEEKQIAQAVRDFLQYKLLSQADARTQADSLLRAGGLEAAAEAKENPTIRELLDRAARELTPEKINASFPNQPLVQAEILRTVGDAYRGVGAFEQAVGLLERSAILRRQHLGPDHLDTLTTMGNLALAHQKAGNLDRAVSLFEETLKLCQTKLRPDHPNTLTSMNNLAGAYVAAGSKLNLAIPLYEETLKLRRETRGTDHPETLSSMNNLAVAYRDVGRYDQALPLQEQSYKLMKAKLGPDHIDTLISMRNLAHAYGVAGKRNLALPLHEETQKLMKEKLGPYHSLTLAGMSSVASAYGDSGKRDLAVSLHQEALKLRQAKLGLDHPGTLSSMNLLAKAYRDAKKLNLALPLFEETLQLRQAKLGPDHPDTLISMNNLASAYWSTKQLDKSIPLFEDVLQRETKKLGRQHPSTLLTAANLGVNYLDASRLDEALPLLEEAAHGARRIPTLRWVNGVLLDGYARVGRSRLAAALAKELVADARTQLLKQSPQLAGQMASIGRSLVQAKAFAEAEPLLRECLAIQEQKLPDDWRTFNAKSLLGGALLGQKKYADAEPLLLAGCEGMKQRAKTIPPPGKVRIAEAIDRLIELYTATNRPVEVKNWRAERAKYQEWAPSPKTVQ